MFFLMILRPPRSTRTDPLLPYTTLFRSASVLLRARARQLWKSELEYAAMLPQPAAPDNHTDCHTSRSEHDRARLPPLRQLVPKQNPAPTLSCPNGSADSRDFTEIRQA